MKFAPAILIVIISVAIIGTSILPSEDRPMAVILIAVGVLAICFTVFIKSRKNKKYLNRRYYSPVLRPKVERTLLQSRQEERDYDTGTEAAKAQENWLKMLDDMQKDLFKEQ